MPQETELISLGEYLNTWESIINKVFQLVKQRNETFLEVPVKSTGAYLVKFTVSCGTIEIDFSDRDIRIKLIDEDGEE